MWLEVRDAPAVDLASAGARRVHQIISMIKWIRTSRLSIKKSLPERRCKAEYWPSEEPGRFKAHWRTVPPFKTFFFCTLLTGPRRSLSLKLSDTKVYEPLRLIL